MKISQTLKNIHKLVSSHRDIAFLLLMLLGVILLAAFKISGTSIYHYYEIFEDQVYRQDELILGTPKFIRADEWNLVTSYTLSQSLNNYAPVNPFVADGQQMSVILDVPTTHWSSLFKLSNYPFFVFSDVETAFAFKWWLRGVVLIFGVYLLLRRLTGRFWLSALGGVIFFFTPFTQWWYSTPAVEVVAYLSLCTWAILNILSAKQKKHMLIYGALLSYFGIATAVMLYPPFIISIGLGVVALIAGYSLNNWDSIKKYSWKFKLITLVFAILCAGGVVVLDYISLKATVDTILNTKYPGTRFLTGGGMDLTVLFSGFFNFRLPDLGAKFPAILVNASEASNFFLVGLLLIPITVFNEAKKLVQRSKPDWITLALVVYILLGIVWVLFGLPEILAKITLLSKVPTNRMLIGIGTFTYILTFYYLSRLSVEIEWKLKAVATRLTIVAFFVGLHIYLLNFFYTQYSGYISDLGTAVILGAVVVISSTLLFGYKRLFIFSLLAFSLYSVYRINPVYRGLDVSKDISIIQDAKTIKTANDKNAGAAERWAVFHNAALGNLLIANGIPTINGTHIYPQFDMWKVLDPDGQLDYYYNRYAHIAFIPKDSGFKFVDTAQQDIAILEIDPCHEFFPKNKVKYMISAVELERECLVKLKTSESLARPMHIYERK